MNVPPEDREAIIQHFRNCVRASDGGDKVISYRASNAAHALDRLTGSDSEADHGAADDILLEFLDWTYPEISAAYRRLQSRASWWATA